MRRGRDDLASTDEVKVYKYEDDDENRASENLSEDKLGLVNETEQGKSSELEGRRFLHNVKTPEGRVGASVPDYLFPSRLSFGYPLIPPYPYPGSSSLGLGGVPLPQHSLPFYMYNNELFAQPPPAHMRLPSLPLPPHPGLSTGSSQSHYGLSPSSHSVTQFSHPFYSPPDFPHMPWPTSMHFGSPYSAAYQQLSRLGSASMLGSLHPGLPYPGVSHPALVTPDVTRETSSPPHTSSAFTSRESRHTSAFLPKRHTSGDSHPAAVGCHPHRHRAVPPVASAMSPSSASPSTSSSATCRGSMSHIKKPLNAFMLFMKEMRQKVIEECTLKESAAINQILGRKWHSLDRAEQARYYEMARREKELHRKRYPTWSARDNYAMHSRKRRKRLEHRPVVRRDGLADDDHDGASAKKCRARFGLDQQSQWCKPCRRKKRCIRFVADGDNDSEDEGDNSTAVSSVPPAADSTTEIFSPMPMSSSSSNSDDPSVRQLTLGAGEPSQNSSASALLRSDAKSYTGHAVSTPSNSGGLISSTIV